MLSSKFATRIETFCGNRMLLLLTGGKTVLGYLNEKLPDRWLGRDDPFLWPPLSPDLIPLAFFLWRYVKDRVFSFPVADIYEQKKGITHISQSTE